MPPSTTLPAARQLAEWALSLKLSDIEPRVLERVKLHILDQIGAQVSCRTLPTCVIAQEYAIKHGFAGPASILGTKLRVDPEFAGLANGTSGSAFEIDDYGGAGANSHPGCTVVPGGLAVAEAVGASGAQFLLAAAVGFETVIRLALASMPSLLVERGFHHTSALGVFAVALETSMLMGDSVDVTVNAISIGGSHASGITEYAQTGGEVKRVHAGMSVAGGIRAARFAQLGLTAPPTVIEGKRGFLQAFCNDYDARPVTENLGGKWHFFDRASIKIFASCALMQPHFAAYDKIKAAHTFSPDDIEDVLLGCDQLTLVHTGGIGPHPTDVLGAQFSSEFGLGLRIVQGRNDVGAYLDAQANGFSDPEVLAMAERVRLERDPECTFEAPAGRVTLRLRDGRTLSDIAFAPGSPGNPATPADYKNKYFGLVSHEFGDDIAQRSMDMIMDIENVKDLGELTRLFENGKA